MTRQKEIREIHKRRHKLFYKWLGILVVIPASIFLTSAIFFNIGAMFFDDGVHGDYRLNFITEAMGVAASIVITSFIIDRRNAHRERENLKRRLVQDAGIPSNDIAISAVARLRYEGWLKGDDGLLREANLSGVNWENMDLNGANLQGVKLENANLKNASLIEAKLQGAKLSNVNLENANLNGAKLQKAGKLQKAELFVVNLEKAILHRANLQGAELHMVNLKNAIMSEANLQEAKLDRVMDLQGTYLQGTYLYKANLQKANLSYADLRETKWLGTANLEGAQLCMADLQGVDLLGTNLQKANLLGANLRGADISPQERVAYPVESPDDVLVLPATALQEATLPNGERYTKETNPYTIQKFTNPKHPEFSKTVKEINSIRRSVRLDDLPES